MAVKLGCPLMLMQVLAEIKSEDAVYVLAYSVIMLNTDLHNPQNRVSVSGSISCACILLIRD